MKRMLFLLMSGLVFCLSSCEDVEVGYLETENAVYSKDTLHLYNVEDRLAKYQGYQVEFDQKGGAEYLGQIDEIEKKKAILQVEQDILYDQLMNLYELIEGGTLSGKELELVEEERARVEGEYYGIVDQMDELDSERFDIWTELTQFTRDLWKSFGETEDIDQLAFEMGRLVRVWEVIPNTISKLKNTMALKIPWVTAPIEGILGTEPLSFSIAGVKNENPENAELFRQALSIMGGGLMHVAQDVEAPSGRYVVSIVVQNEGQRALLEDIFTFIVDK